MLGKLVLTDYMMGIILIVWFHLVLAWPDSAHAPLISLQNEVAPQYALLVVIPTVWVLHALGHYVRDLHRSVTARRFDNRVSPAAPLAGSDAAAGCGAPLSPSHLRPGGSERGASTAPLDAALATAAVPPVDAVNAPADAYPVADANCRVTDPSRTSYETDSCRTTAERGDASNRTTVDSGEPDGGSATETPSEREQRLAHERQRRGHQVHERERDQKAPNHLANVLRR